MKTTLRFLPSLILSITILLTAQVAQAHCQVPCGIYDDHARVEAMAEDAVTVAKACKMIAELEGKTDAQSQQQLVRWVSNKELHAQKIISTISDYFLTQRVKASQEDYVERLKSHHAVIVAAMKAKQHADAKSAKALADAISVLEHYYPKS
ncbi:superoxide dismutase, Ni [Coraliomargarita akajimensis]|uniref:Superoxide dismutase Ni-type n=1 Tax=Coraliomargarita akajimensis (strain DSM 45221 / IAM 15411 / JCM 23193 / KCTC 12865 / 04OKA010-24) TaxID=583355 RepID=D5EIK0_CORAD|nr:superoxide dismutase, Ni [Coraliomargarita akajimensis]ADE54266.1 Superoxide dismutase Ni-type [Coraliomargarita akajimensis DSM 45221]